MMDSTQNGSFKRKSTEYPILQQIDTILDIIEKESSLDVIFIDFS